MRERNGRGGGSGGGHDAAGGMRWLLTYADLITLLMVFFVVLYAMSSADQRKFNALKTSLQTALRTDGAGTNMVMEYSGSQAVEPPVQRDNKNMDEEFREIISKVQGGMADPRAVGFIIDERGLTIRFLDSVLFDLGKAELRPAALPILDVVGKALQGEDNHIRIEGYTDNLPIRTSQFPTNWELSAARSIAVTRYLIEKNNMNPQYLSSLGYGEYHPLYPNNSDENRAKNRRVDIVVLRVDHSGGEIENK